MKEVSVGDREGELPERGETKRAPSYTLSHTHSPPEQHSGAERSRMGGVFAQRDTEAKRKTDRVDASRQAGRDGEDTHLTHPHTCSHTHGNADTGARYGGPGSSDARENPPADAQAAGGDSAEEQRREANQFRALRFCPSNSTLPCYSIDSLGSRPASRTAEVTAWDHLMKEAEKMGKKDECMLMGKSLLNSISPITGCGDPKMFLKYPSTICALCQTEIARLS
ncbi:hypothetical protein Q8A73_004676 [Channa argus]|nr:hypothetical protein Q8A73_004676 [Channa argus]